MALVRRSPLTTWIWDPIRDMERVLQSVFPEIRAFFDETAFAPAIDMYERAETLVIEVDLPGLTKEDLQVRVENGVLYIAGDRKALEGVAQDQYHCQERWSGKFYRSITLPDFVDPHQATAEFQNGVLRVTFPKKPEARPIEVKVQ
ncbi:MAG: Hsp20/alpha crystallin family protein [Acidobacteria bacterium]|nr:Hsp20/alpha crystallin family protein [Acidobacteriota bacterium]MDW7985186.1 Hsp20/alpha crystallin family protein [Acidobacteriota bacterium]